MAWPVGAKEVEGLGEGETAAGDRVLFGVLAGPTMVHTGLRGSESQ